MTKFQKRQGNRWEQRQEKMQDHFSSTWEGKYYEIDKPKFKIYKWVSIQLFKDQTKKISVP